MAFKDVILEGFVGSSWWVSFCKAGSWGTDLPKCITENWRCPFALVAARSPRMCQPYFSYARLPVRRHFSGPAPAICVICSTKALLSCCEHAASH